MNQDSGRLQFVLPWVLLIGALLAISVLYQDKGNGIAVFQAAVVKDKLLASLHIRLLETIEAEKNAVLADSSDASESFAAAGRQAAERLEDERKQLEALLQPSRQLDVMNEFNTCWAQFRKLNDTILVLATQITNVKARQLSIAKCSIEMTTFEQSLRQVIALGTTGNSLDEIVVPAYEALTGGLGIYARHERHIEELDEATMDQIERLIESDDAAVKAAFIELQAVPALSGNADLRDAMAAYSRFMTLTAEVLRLSRLNTNPKSAALSLGRNRLVAAQCQGILVALETAVAAERADATR